MRCGGIPGLESYIFKTPFNISTTIDLVKLQIFAMESGLEPSEEDKEVTMLTKLLGNNTFPFTYDGTDDTCPDPGHEIAKFTKGKKDYTFRLQSIYLVQLPRAHVSTPRKQKVDEAGFEWLVTPPRTKKSAFADNPLK